MFILSSEAHLAVQFRNGWVSEFCMDYHYYKVFYMISLIFVSFFNTCFISKYIFKINNSIKEIIKIFDYLFMLNEGIF